MTTAEPTSRSWRTNNPGLLGLGVLTAQHDAIGQMLGVVVFQNPEMICTGEGSDPKTNRVEWPVYWSDPAEGIEHVCARVRLDLNGDGSMWLPMPLGDTGTIVSEEMPAKEEVESLNCSAWLDKDTMQWKTRGAMDRTRVIPFAVRFNGPHS